MTDAAQKLAVDVCADFEGFRAFPYPDAASPLAQATPKVRWGYSAPLELLSRLPHSTQTLDGSPWTNGYGQTGPDVTPSTPEISEPNARARLGIEVAKRVQEIRTRSARELTSGQVAALASFLFNVGPGKKGAKDGLFMLKSGRPSTLWMAVQAGLDDKAAKEFGKWTSAQGQQMPGLVRRRAAERALYVRAP